ncbi:MULTISPECIES: hypothetical protein [unclassified Pseudoalteromonas]|uniref:hypothetical protein n=1 Tax=unclassified Pseudoalteromonas TaxID=194690 RepID=UPI000CF62912|nr:MULTISPECIES: hypothetical protein [unclassified Pseudoalteromonas]MBS3799194.1 hypothetical protein [Pseudoalteromonas sp. BDTF-M6]
MYSNFLLTGAQQLDNQQRGFQWCVIGGNWAMVMSFMTTALCLLITYKFNHYFSIPAQVSAHIATIVFAAFFKVGYVVRCVGLHGLGYSVK